MGFNNVPEHMEMLRDAFDEEEQKEKSPCYVNNKSWK